MPVTTAFYHAMATTGLADCQRWTVSTRSKDPKNDKRPINARLGVANHWFIDANGRMPWFTWASNDNDPLVTLADLRTAPDGFTNNVAFRADFDHASVLLIDIEADCDPATKAQLKLLPYTYLEWSRHHGVHMLVPVPADLRSKLKYQTLFNRTSLKWGQVADQSHSGVELFFHDHYLTFTGNIIATSNPLLTDPTTGYNALVQLLDHLSQQSVQTQTATPHYIENQQVLPYPALVLAAYGLTDRQKAKFMTWLADADQSDRSRFEWQAALRLASYLQNNADDHWRNCLPIIFTNLDADELTSPANHTYAVIKLLTKTLPARDKWNKFYQNDQLTYLELVASKAVAYIRAHHQIKNPDPA